MTAKHCRTPDIRGLLREHPGSRTGSGHGGSTGSIALAEAQSAGHLARTACLHAALLAWLPSHTRTGATRVQKEYRGQPGL